jgi:hypothetical protein
MYIIVTLKYKAVIKHISLYYILRFYFPFVFVSAAGHYFRIWTGQLPALF